MESRRVREPRGTALPCGSVSGFMVMGLVSGLSLANHLAWLIFGPTQGPSWWHTHLSHDGFQRGGFWEVGGTYGLESPLSF